MNNTTKWIIGVIILAVIWIGYSYSQPSSQYTAKESIKIGGIFALTGLGASQGEQELKGARLAVMDINKRGGINGRPLELVAEDVSLDKLKIAGTVANKLINIDKVVAIVGTTWDEPAQVILPIIEKANVPMVGQNQTKTLENETQYEYFFSTWYDNEVGIQKLLSFAKQKEWNRIAIIRPIGAGFYQYISNLTEKYASKFGIEIVENLNLNNPAISDFRTDLAKIKVKKPDAILIVLNGFTGCPFLKQVHELKIDAVILSTEAAGDYSLLRQCAELMENLYFSYPKESIGYKKFAESYYDQFNSYPETPSIMTAYDAVMIIAEALKQTDGQGGEMLRDIISDTTNYSGVSLDSVSFDSIGFVKTPDDAFEIRTVQNGEFIKLQ